MRQWRAHVGMAIIISGFFVASMPVFASSLQAYQDYIFQNDQYRQKYTEFQIARNEYQKFKTLTAEATALDRTRSMLTQRNQAIRAYLLLLNEKINEVPAMSDTDRKLYQTLINDEVKFLENHSQFIPSVTSIADAVKVSQELENHYLVLQGSMRQTIIGLSISQLTDIGKQYEQRLNESKSVLNSSRSNFSLQKQNILDNWLLQITNKRTLFQQKLEQLRLNNSQFTGSTISELDAKFLTAQKTVNGAKQELIDGTSYMKELLAAMRFAD